MKILLDEMYAGLKPFLKLLGWNAATVQEEGLKAAADEEVVKYSEQKNFVLVTQEPSVAELARLKKVPHVFVSLADVARVVDERLKELSKKSAE